MPTVVYLCALWLPIAIGCTGRLKFLHKLNQKTMLKNTLILLLCLLMSCGIIKKEEPPGPRGTTSTSPKIEAVKLDSIQMSHLTINLLTGIPNDYIGDADSKHTITLDSLVLPFDDRLLLSSNRVASLGNVTKDTVQIAPGQGTPTDHAPYAIGGIKINKIILESAGRKYVYEKPMEMVNINIKHFDMAFEPSAPLVTKILTTVDSLESRIRRLRRATELRTLAEPNYAGRNLPPLFDVLLNTLHQIRRTHRARTQRLIDNTMIVDLDELRNIEFTVEGLEDQLDDSRTNPQKFNNEVLFATGEFDMSFSGKRELSKVIGSIVDRAAATQKEYPGRPVLVTLAITGYADEQEVKPYLEAALVAKYPKEIGRDQATLNKMLSQARADQIYAYLQQGLLGQEVSLELETIEGKGWEYPPGLKQNACRDDCQARRVAFISSIVVPSPN